MSAMKKVLEEQLQQVKEYVRNHYDEGGHWVYETHDDKDYTNLLMHCGLEDTKKQLKDYWEMMLEQESNCRFGDEF